MERNFIDLLIQLPLVGIFIWYSLEVNKRFQQIADAFTDSLARHDQAVDKRIDALIASQNQSNNMLADSLRTHDDALRRVLEMRFGAKDNK